jgi:cephalosporin hydroxylase
MWKPPFRVKRYANARYKFLVRGKVDGKWKRRYFSTEPEAIAFADAQNAAAEKGIPSPLPITSPPALRFPGAPEELSAPIRTLQKLDFADLNKPIYLGPRIERYLGDSWCMHLPFAYDLMRELRPRVFVELGVKQGESYFAFCQAAVDHKINVRCYGIDSWRGDIQTGNLDPEIEHEVARYNWRYSSFSELKVMLFSEAVDQFADESIDLLHIDGTHTYAEVKADFESWVPKLSPHGVILFHDVVIRDGGFGVWKLWEEIRGENNSFLFEFGHGLGVWTKQPVSDQDPEFVRKLMMADELGKRSLNHFYANAAAALALWHDLQMQPDAASVVERLRHDIEEKETQIERLEKDVEERAKHLTILQTENEEKTRQVFHFQRDAEERAKHVAILQTENEEKTRQVADWQREAEARSAEISDLQQRLESLSTEVDQLREGTRKISELQGDEEKKLQVIETLKVLLEQKEDLLARASKDLLDAQWEALTLRGAVLGKADSPDLAFSRVLDLENRTELAESDRDHLREMVLGLQKDVEKAHLSQQSSWRELQTVQDQLGASLKKLGLYRKQLDRLRQSISRKLILPFGRSQRKIQELTALPNHD